MTVSNFGDFYNGALKVFETVCQRTSAHPTMCANDILLQTRNTSDDDDDLFNQPLLVYILASRSLIDEPKKGISSEFNSGDDRLIISNV